MSAHASLDSVLAALAKAVPAAQRDRARTFAAAYFARLPEDELALRPAATWAGIAASALAFAQSRPPGVAKIRAFNVSAAEGFETAYTVVQIVNDDMPFLVDSVSMALSQRGIAIHGLVHPVFAVSRDGGGELTAVGTGAAESYMHLEIDRQADDADLRAIEAAIATALADVRASVADWEAMRDKMLAIAEELSTRPMPASDESRSEAQAFLRWAADNHFTFLGYREYEVGTHDGKRMLCPVKGSGLGLMHGKDELAAPRPLTGLAASDLPPGARLEPLILTKTNARSTVHRPGYMDYVGVLQFDDKGLAIREQRFLGLYTSSAYNRRPWDIPLVRQRHEAVMAASGLAENSHSGKALRHILETLPRDELFQSSPEELVRTCMGILSLQERVRPRLFLRRDRHGRFYSALVYIPRERFSTEVRERIEAMLMRELHGERLDTTIQIGESPLAQLHLIIRPKSGDKVQVDGAALEAELTRIVRNWHDELRDQLVTQHGEEPGQRLAARFARALPAGYVESVTPELAAGDLLQADALSGDKDLRLSLYRSGEGELRFKLFRLGKEIALSDALPMLENLGLRINSEHPYEIDLDDGRVVIQDFEVEPLSGTVDAESARTRFEEAFAAVWRGDAESDGFNRLVLAAGLGWRQVAMLRGYCKYLLQTGVTFSQIYMEETLARYPLIARLLVELFEARFEPGREIKADPKTCNALRQSLTDVVPMEDRHKLGTILEEMGADRALDRSAQIDACSDALAIVLENVSSLDEDRILRSFMAVIHATLRTSYFQKKGEGGTHKDYISFKFDPAKVPDLPKPRPYREIFVYSPFVEGVHLRFGPVARGGLRWSDRREDFRTEVLGLVKAQMVKNTVIVPVGSKGGFFAKRSPVGGDRDAVLAEGIACYKRFINGLLDITDNIVDGKIVNPENVVRHDLDDPYLVVAADKGTATFSDIANGISAEHGFWLDDAFASGGSVGYDHKGMGITAKGGWESVKRHFRALGRDSQTQDFTCVGVGDMSGDVFGNGMLLSKHIRLLAAFDHRHIFLDPNPDSAQSFVERQRLFNLPRSSWDDYDRALISKGGGIFARGAKTIALSPEIKAALDIQSDAEQMTPADLMNAILKAPVDLLWNGGIGTYVKSSSETNADCGDRANNALRVSGNELRCKMVGEGGNLGMTQRGRIEAAQHGVLLNTDFIDNSAGVDTSDHEVNIKILLGAIVKRGELSMAQRNTLLASMTDEVGDLVLNDNYRQNQAISLMEAMSAARLGSFGHFIRTLESQGLLDRAIEFLPSDAELGERKSRGQGLTRPELSVLLSYDKIVIFNQLLESDVPEDPYLSKELVRYFPKALQDKYAADMENHRLRREIIATAVTNSMVNRMGSTFLLRMQEDTGETPAQIAKGYTITREVLGTRDWWAGIDALDLKVPESAQIEALSDIWHLQRNMARWLLNRPDGTLNIAQMVERYATPMRDLREALPTILPAESRASLEADKAQWQAQGFPADLAQAFASLPYLTYALDIIEVALERKLAVADVGQVYFALSDALHSKWLMDNVEKLPVEGRWHAQARGVLRDELQAQQRSLVGIVLGSGTNAQKPDALVAQWLARDDASLKYTLSMFADMRNLRSMDFATLSVAVRRLAQIAAAGARAA
ncbi:MAG TPA: NAD-glutamate dehydrogenase domain-containing protein [Arenimonas sp.]|uniref:NAD-glutamate dehydrogenase n=1 Tax=Arenimonas sp. TaxID=1872635 RepID=UPI002C9554F1|nr:NAD-glutamate dehydrogenase domain-containing protein [Arenimonas sp.]HMB56394.1 NAD-glutamate dehydrogenase domain-containing protein [Arenimonas sp.]